MKKKVRILTIDGGGIRGIIPAVILSYIEEQIQYKTNNPNAVLADYFDMIAGTSTGGILTCIYLLPPLPDDTKSSRYFAREAVDFYKNHAKDIFDKNFWSIKSAVGPKYKVKGFEKVLREKMGDAKLSDMPKPCLVTAYDISLRCALFMCSHSAKASPYKDYYIRDVARATSAAPTYFEPAKVTSGAGAVNYLVDGAMFANNATMCTLIETRKVNFPDNPMPAFGDLLVVSLGTGKVVKKYDYDKAKGWGALGWMFPVIDILMSASPEVVHYQAQKLFESKGCIGNYIRIDPPLGMAQPEMDDVSDKNLKDLENAGKNYVSQNTGYLDNLVDMLINNE